MTTAADKVVVVLAALLVVALYAAFWVPRSPGDEVRVMVGGEEYRRLSLSEDTHLSVPGSLGVSELEVKDGRARFVSSPCTGKHCIHSGWLAQGGEFAACLPNRISLQVVGKETRFDSINF